MKPVKSDIQKALDMMRDPRTEIVIASVMFEKPALVCYARRPDANCDGGGFVNLGLVERFDWVPA